MRMAIVWLSRADLYHLLNGSDRRYETEYQSGEQRLHVLAFRFTTTRDLYRAEVDRKISSVVN